MNSFISVYRRIHFHRYLKKIYRKHVATAVEDGWIHSAFFYSVQTYFDFEGVSNSLAQQKFGDMQPKRFNQTI